MKKTATLLSISLLFALPASAEAQGLRRDSVGYAAWKLPSKNESRSRFLVVWAEQNQDFMGDSDLKGTIRVLSCSSDSAESEDEKCRLRKEIAFKKGTLTVADDASSGQLTMQVDGARHEVNWTRQGTIPFVGQWEDTCPSGQGLGVGPGAPATASGEVLGRRFTDSDAEVAEIGYGVIASSCS